MVQSEDKVDIISKVTFLGIEVEEVMLVVKLFKDLIFRCNHIIHNRE